MLLDASLRGGAIALFCLLAISGLRDVRRLPSARYAVIFDVCAIAYLLESAPPLQQVPSIAPLRVLSNATPGVFLLWSEAVFDDAFTPRWWRWTPFMALLLLAAWVVASDTTVAWRVMHAAALLCTVAGFYQVLNGWGPDLVEGRRRVRLVFAGAIGACIVLTMLIGAVGATLLPAVTAVLGIALAAALLRLRVEQPALVPITVQPAPPDAMDQQDQRLAVRLRTVMDQERAYREAGLTIASLAERLNVPEYRLRRLINQRLGHRNFVTYVNGYRLTEAQQALADPAQVRVPVLTIALDAGFQSIGPFNRAFKALSGETPTEYRRRSLADSGIGQDLQG